MKMIPKHMTEQSRVVLDWYFRWIRTAKVIAGILYPTLRHKSGEILVQALPCLCPFYRIQIRRATLLAFAFVLALPAASGETLGRARFSWEAVANPVVIGYKAHWGTQSGVYTHSFDAGNVTEVIIQEFSDGVEYFAAITAYSDSGEESDYSTELSFIYDTTDRVVFLEAENGVLTAPMRVASDASNTWVAASSADPAATTTLNFVTPYASDFYVWCRVLAPSASSDSFNVTVDQDPELAYHVYGESSPQAAAYKSDWTWSRIQISPGTAHAFALGGGSHSIRFRYLENALLDRVVIVSNPDFVPTDALPHSGDYVGVIDQPQDSSVAVSGSVTLAAMIIATGPVNFQWFHAGVSVPSANQTSLSLTNVQEANGGTYSLSASSNTASAFTRTATLSVVPPVIILPPTPFRVRKLSIAGAGQVTFEIEGSMGTGIGVYASSDLVNWSLVATCANSGNTFTVTDLGAIGATKRFYQLSDSGRP
jgi:hypothetical protein